MVASGYGHSALVAESHPLFRQALSHLLKKQLEFSVVVESTSLAETLDHLSRNSEITFLSIDIQMDGMAGTASLLRLRKAFPYIRIVVITASDTPNDIIAALAVGVHGYLPKTMRDVEVTAAFQTILSGGIYVPPGLPTCIIDSMVTHPVSVQRYKTEPAYERAQLSPRQRDVIRLIALGQSNKEIARELQLSEGTIKVHVNAVYRTLGTHSRTGALAALAKLNGSAVL